MTTNGHDRTTRLLGSYRMNMDRGFLAVRAMILNDIRQFTDLGAERYAADLRSALIRLEGEAVGSYPAIDLDRGALTAG